MSSLRSRTRSKKAPSPSVLNTLYSIWPMCEWNNYAFRLRYLYLILYWKYFDIRHEKFFTKLILQWCWLNSLNTHSTTLYEEQRPSRFFDSNSQNLNVLWCMDELLNMKGETNHLNSKMLYYLKFRLIANFVKFWEKLKNLLKRTTSYRLNLRS